MTVPNRPVSGAPIETAWGDVVHDTTVAQDIQAGSVVVSLVGGASSNDGTVTFPRPFGGVPIVVVGGVGGQTTLAALVSVPTATGCVVRAFKRDGTAFGSAGSLTVEWLAYGPRA